LRLRFGWPEERVGCPAFVQHLSSFCPGFVQLLSSLSSPSGVPMEDKFRDVLNGIDPKQGRSRLELYGEFVDELRRQGFTCREIAALLLEKFQFKTSKSAVNNFVRVRTRRQRNAARQISRPGAIPPPIVAKRAGLHSGPGPSENELRQRIAAMKARKPATTSSDNDFYFDPSEPLRLIDPRKRDSND
jgi:hypothetical protein